MAFSFVRIILSDTYHEIYTRGVAYYLQNAVTLATISNASCTADVQGTTIYTVRLGFKKIGSPAYNCSCPFLADRKRKIPCKHIISVALAWDAHRGVPVPDEDTVTELTIPPPAVTRNNIKEAYANPLHADLHIIRIAADEIGSWSRPHARLPDAPTQCQHPYTDSTDLEKALQELKNWTNRRSYDLYFCAGEVVAGFCEICRWIAPSITTCSPANRLEVFSKLVQWHRRVILELIDDSNGLHEFSEAHILLIYEILRQHTPTNDHTYSDTLEHMRTMVTDY